MKIIAGERGAGITTSLILEVSKFGGTIITVSPRQAEWIKDKAKNLGVEPPNAISIMKIIDDMENGVEPNYDVDNVYLDNASLVIGYLLKAVGVHGKLVGLGVNFDRNDY